MNKIFVIAILVILLGTALFVFDVLPLTMVVNTTTQNYTEDEITGYGELLGPRERKGYIESYLATGYSEDITARGKFMFKEEYGWPAVSVSKCKYIVYGDFGTGWLIISQPGTETKYVFPPSAVLSTPQYTTFGSGGPHSLPDYDFNIIGPKLFAIKVEAWIYVDFSYGYPWGAGYQWVKIQSDEAYIHSGWGGLYYHNSDTEMSEYVRPQQTYEIGEKVIIDVWTAYGGTTFTTNDVSGITGITGGQKTWSVMLREPSDRGGKVMKTQLYDDNVKGRFEFTVTEDMFSKNSDNEYKIELYNTWVSMGHLRVYSIDLKALAPGDVEFYGNDAYKVGDSYQTKVGEPCTIKFKSTVNPTTQYDINRFIVSVAYIGADTLLPSEGPEHPIWLIYTKYVAANNNEASITFTPTKKSFVTVFANAQDQDGRTNIHPTVFTLWAYEGTTPAPSDTVDDETGQQDYWGGHTPDWQPWEPSTDYWSSPYWMIIATLIAIAIFLLIAFVAALLPINLIIKLIFIVIGAVIAYLVYLYLSSDVSILADFFKGFL